MGLFDWSTLLLVALSLCTFFCIWKQLAKPKSKWTKVKLAQRTQLTHNTFVFRFKFPSNKRQLALPVGKHIQLMFVHSKGKKIVRNYTPIAEAPGYFDLLIKVYPNGKMTQHLLQMKVGCQINISSPLGKFDLNAISGAYEGFLMLAGGTGITPMWQIIRSSHFELKEKRLIFGNVAEEDILLRDELEGKKSEFFHPVHVLNEHSAQWKGEVGFITKELVEREMGKFKRKNLMILICGPLPMMRVLEKMCEENNWEHFVF